MGDVTIYLVRGSLRQPARYGDGARDGGVHLSVAVVESERLEPAHGVSDRGARWAHLSEPLIVQPGQWIKWTLEADLTRSSMAVY